MKKLLYVIIAVMIAGVAFGQVTKSKMLDDRTITLDGAVAGGDCDTTNFPLPLGLNRGYPFLEINPNAVKASSATDSLTMRYRGARGIAIADTFVQDWSPLNIDLFETTDAAITDYDWADSAWYHCPIDLGGEPYDYIQIESRFEGASANDSLEVRIILRDAPNQ